MSSAPVPPEDLHVEVDANVVRQLGEELITDAEQALLELIKNAYDADAEVARVTIDTESRSDDVAGGHPLIGSIVVSDNGTGMDLSAIRRGWLTISLSLKREMKQRGRKTPRHHRTPLGDKGLGRLGTMKIGDTIEIITHSDDDEEGYRVRLSWSSFAPGTLLSRVPVELERVAPATRPGTKLTILGLHEPNYWRGPLRQRRLAESMSSLISPFKKFTDFRISLEVDGSKLELHEVGENVRNGATARFAFEWTGTKLRCQAHFKLGLFRGSGEPEDFERRVASDKGAGLARFLKTEAKVRGQVSVPSKGPWFVEVYEEVAKEEVIPGDAEDPGPFAGEVDTFDLDALDPTNVFSTSNEYRQYIRRFAGVSVYRDHFAIRMDEDWLRLGQSWTSGRSYYGLRPANTIGFFEISASGNPKLREKSDREGFLETSASRGFFAITQQCVAFANSALTDVRRAFLLFRDRQVSAEAELPSAWTPPDALRALSGAREAAKRAQSTLASADRHRRASVVKVRDSLRRLVRQGTLPSSDLKAATAAIQQLDGVVGEWEKQRSALDGQLQALKGDQALTTALLQRFENFKNQLAEVYEAVGLGLVAEGLAHEISGILEELVQRTNRAAPRAKRSGDASLVGYVEAVRATVSALRKQVSFLDPMLRGTREQRSTFSVMKFVEDFIELRRERLSRFGIEPILKTESDFTVRMSRGRLQQVLDNLVRNSEFWIRSRVKEGDDGVRNQIVFEVASPSVVVSDTGPAVKPSLESVVFEPFISGKPGGQGRGLGLFISKQLLQRDGCDITLEPERNAKGRRYRFAIDLRAVLSSE